MSFYSLALFAHILGVLVLFTGIGFEWTSLLRLRRAQTVAQVREATGLLSVQEQLLRLGALVILLAGIYMTVTAWSWRTPWIVVALVMLVMQGVLGGSVNARRFKAIQLAAVASEASASARSATRCCEPRCRPMALSVWALSF